MFLVFDLIKYSSENKIIKVIAQCKNSPNGPLTSVEEVYGLGNKCTLPQAALPSDMNLENSFRTLTVIMRVLKVYAPSYRHS